MKHSAIHGIKAILLLLMAFVSVGAASIPASGPAQPSAPSVPATWPHAQDLDTASRQFMAWQAAMLEERAALAREQVRLLHSRMKVPPPMPPSVSGSEPSIPASLADLGSRIFRLDIPLPLPTDAQLTVFAGEPSVSFNAGAEGKLLSFAGASYKAGATYSAKDNKWLVGTTKDFKLAYDAGPVEIAGTYQYESSSWTQTTKGGPAGIEISADLATVKGTLGYNTQNELSATVGYDLVKTPEALSLLAEASLGVEAQISAPVVIHGLTRGKRTLSSSLMDYSIKAANLLFRPVDCPHCSAKGQLDCGTCQNTRKVVCGKCGGKLRFTCTTCEGGGLLYCSTCSHTGEVSCGRCGGSGQLRCSTCGGRGQVTVYETEIQSRQELVVDKVGFDEAGNPVYERHYETRYFNAQVPKSQTCGSCSGSGQGGECGACGGDGRVTCGRCGGDGTVQCRRCSGSGMVDCGTCRGTGQTTCPECHGKPFVCPLCKGKQQLGI